MALGRRWVKLGQPQPDRTWRRIRTRSVRSGVRYRDGPMLMLVFAAEPDARCAFSRSTQIDMASAYLRQRFVLTTVGGFCLGQVNSLSKQAEVGTAPQASLFGSCLRRSSSGLDLGRSRRLYRVGSRLQRQVVMVLGLRGKIKNTSSAPTLWSRSIG